MSWLRCLAGSSLTGNSPETLPIEKQGFGGCEGARTVFVVTVDTEADDEWTRSGAPSYENTRALPAFQELCDRYGVRPTYLVTYDVAADKDSLAILRDLLQDGNCEIGAHLHGWRTPPFYDPLDSSSQCHAYLYEYPKEVQAEKVKVLTEFLAQSFQVKMQSYRAGRWGIDSYGIALLEATGYRIDTSVAPLRSWAEKKGDPEGKGGPSFRRAPMRPYYASVDDVQQPGTSNILEIPVSVRILSPALKVDWVRAFAGVFSGGGIGRRIIRNILRKLGIAELITLNPAVNSLRHMTILAQRLIKTGEPIINMALHSSELMAECSPEVRDVHDQQLVWQRLKDIFTFVSNYSQIQKLTLTEYAQVHEEPDCAIADRTRKSNTTDVKS